MGPMITTATIIALAVNFIIYFLFTKEILKSCLLVHRWIEPDNNRDKLKFSITRIHEIQYLHLIVLFVVMCHASINEKEVFFLALFGAGSFIFNDRAFDRIYGCIRDNDYKLIMNGFFLMIFMFITFCAFSYQFYSQI